MTQQDQFLILLRSGLWGTSISDVESFSKTSEWENIYRLSVSQTVLGLVYDGIERLPLSVRPPKDLWLRWNVTVAKIEQTHHLLNKVLAKVVALYAREGFRSVLLKGQGCADCYIRPERRHCGDIDILVGEKDFRRVNEMFQTKSGVRCVDVVRKTRLARRILLLLLGRRTWLLGKHRSFMYKGVTIENHRVATYFYNIRNNWAFSRLLNEWFPESNRLLRVEDVTVTLPPPNFDAIYQLCHIVQHFMKEGVGIRQLCDWARFLYVYRDQIDEKKLRHDVRLMRMERSWGIFGYIVVRYLGLPSEYILLAYEEYAEIGDQVFACIMKEGNFGESIRSRAIDLLPVMYHRGERFSFTWLRKRIGHIAYVYPKEEHWMFLSDLKLALKTLIWKNNCDK